MAYPSTLVRTKTWGTETLTASDLHGQLDLIINWIMAFADNSTGHDHSGSNKGKSITLAAAGSGVTGVLPLANGGTGLSAVGTAYQVLRTNSGATAIEWGTNYNWADRGDPSSADVTQASMTFDATWRDIDLSSVLPSGAVAAFIKVTIVCNTANKALQFRKKGNSNAINTSEIDSQVINVTHSADLLVPCDTSRFIQYNGASGATWSSVSITVKGWLMSG